MIYNSKWWFTFAFCRDNCKWWFANFCLCHLPVSAAVTHTQKLLRPSLKRFLQKINGYFFHCKLHLFCIWFIQHLINFSSKSMSLQCSNSEQINLIGFIKLNQLHFVKDWIVLVLQWLLHCTIASKAATLHLCYNSCYIATLLQRLLHCTIASKI